MMIGLNQINEDYGILSGIMIIIIVASMFAYIYPAVSYRHINPSGKDYVQYISKLAGNNSVIFDYSDYLVFYTYYAKREVNGCPLTDDIESLNKQISYINDYLAEGKKIFLSQYCFATGTASQREKLISSINNSYKLVPVGYKLVDDFHKTSLDVNLQRINIYRLELKEENNTTAK